MAMFVKPMQIYHANIIHGDVNKLCLVLSNFELCKTLHKSVQCFLITGKSYSTVCFVQVH